MKSTLLLGSGFSKNFGGFLPSEVFLKIFNHENISSDLKISLLKFQKNYDFESFYQFVIDCGKYDEDKNFVKKMMTEIFSEMDNVICRNLYENVIKFSYLAVINFIVNKFSFSEGGSGYIFSLNQDLLLERLAADYLKKLNFDIRSGRDGEVHGLLLPHYGPVNSPFYGYRENDPSRYAQSVFINENIIQQKIDAWKKSHENTYEQIHRIVPCLVKLHGSYYWDVDNNNKKLWIIGGNKKENIYRNPLLSLYFEKFKEVMYLTNKLYVIGYGFGDPHINEVIQESCENGTQLIVIDVIGFNEWLEMIEQKIEGFCFNWLCAYYNSPFFDFFPLSSREKDFKFDGHLNTGLNSLKSFRFFIK